MMRRYEKGQRVKKGKRLARKMLATALIATMAIPSGVAWGEIPDPAGFASEWGNLDVAADFEQLRAKWKVLLTGGDDLDAAGVLAADYAAYVDELAGKQWDSLIKLGDTEVDERTCLFSDLPLTDKKTKTGSSQITLTFDRLKAIVLAYETKGSEFYQRDDVKKEIVAALDLMIENHYSLSYACNGTGTTANGGSFGNWYDWRIGTPRQLCDLLLMLCDELTTEQIDRYTAPIMANNKKVDTTGANRTWIANIFIQTGILRGEGELIEAGKTGVKDVFKYVTSGDGFYEDGSFVQHTYYAYTGGYGKALLCTMAPMMYVLNGTEYEISYDDNCQQIFYDMIFEAYEPLIYGGRFMDMAREREISRIANQDSIPGRQAIRSIIMLLDVLPAEQQERGYRMVKEWLSDDEVLAQVCIDPVEGYNEYYLPAGVIQMAADIAGSDVEPRGNLVKHKRFGAMDRIVHLRDDFAYTVSMSSKRIRNTEGTNDEGLRLWHIGDGLTYLYNEDKTYYSDHYWATVDHQRLPGTTVNRVPGRGAKVGYGTQNPYDFAGGTDLGEYGIAGMELQGVGSSGRDGAHSRKSWFMFDDEVVAVGSDIRSTLSGSDVETIVENRKVNLDKSNVLTVDGEEQRFASGGDPYVEENRAMKVTTVTSASGKNVIAGVSLPQEVEGNQMVEFDCKIKMPVTNNFFALKLYGNVEGKGEKNCVFLTMRNGAMVPRLTGGKDAYSSEAGLSPDTWHDVHVELNLATQTFNYYFDGEQVTEGKSVDANTINANLVDAKCFASFEDADLANSTLKLSRFEIMTPAGGTGTIFVDDISIKSGGQVLFAEDFEEAAAGAPDGRWTITQNDTAAGAGAVVNLDQVTVIPEGTDDFNGMHTDTEWIHLAGSDSASDVGYYFPGKADIEGIRETRKGSWNLVNIYEKFTDNEDRMNSFVTFWFDHGQKPSKEMYSYVVLPGRSAEETKEYNENPDVEILSQTESIHAVREKNLGITGINFFEKETYGAFTAAQPQSVMVQEEEDGFVNISFADPTQTASSLSLYAALPIMEVVSMDEGITAKDENGAMVFTTESDKSARAQAGRSWHVTVKLGGNDNMFETMEPGQEPEHWTVDNGSAIVRAEDNGNHVLEIEADGKDAVTAETVLVYSEEGGSAIRFQIKPVTGTGKVFLGDGENRMDVLSFGNSDSKAKGAAYPLEPGKWYDVKIKVNPETSYLQVMVDGTLYGEPLPFEGSMEDTLGTFSVEASGGAKVLLDNLVVRQVSVTPPDVPKNLTYTAYGDTYVELQWDKVESENPVYYLLSVDGDESEELIRETSYKVTGLEPGETYVFSVRSVDDEENCSDWSGELSLKLLEEQNIRYVINFNDYKSGEGSQQRWAYGGSDPKGVIEIVDSPEGKDDTGVEGMLTDLEYWNRTTASPSNAEKITSASKATPANADAEEVDEGAEDHWIPKATESNAKEVNAAAEGNDQVLYVYSGTKGSDKNTEYKFDKQTREQTYELDVYFEKSVSYTNFALVGSNGNQAATMMLDDSGVVGYRAGDAPSTTKRLLSEPVEGEWIHFVITADPEKQIYSISANGDKKEDLKFRAATSDIAALRINAPNNAIGGIYVDNIILPTDEDYGKWILTALDEELPEDLEVPYGTEFEDLELPLYVDVKAITPTGEEETTQVRVNWNSQDYDESASGYHTIHGTFALPSNYISKISDSNLKVRVKVEKEIPVYKVTLVQSAGGAIESDTEEAEEGTTITLTAIPDEGYMLAHWIINDVKKSSGDITYTMELTKDVVVSAVFEAEDVKPDIKYYKVDVPKNLNGGRILVSSTYAKEGTEIIVTAIPDEGYLLAQLKVDGRKVEVDEDNQYSFILSGNTRISGIFKLDKNEGDDGSGDEDDGDDSGKDDNNENDNNNGNHDSGSGNSSDGDSVTSRKNTAPEAAYAVRGTWSKSGDRWQFRLANGELAVSQWACIWWNDSYEWFYFDTEAMLATGWVTLNGQTFYLQAVSDGTLGRMMTGWQQIDGKWYWFNTVSDGNKGVLLKNGVTPDGYPVGEDGVCLTK